MTSETRLVQVRQQVLKHNNVVADGLRQRFRDAGVFVVSLVSSPGAGKTSFLEAVLRRLGRPLTLPSPPAAGGEGDTKAESAARRPSPTAAGGEGRVSPYPLPRCGGEGRVRGPYRVAALVGDLATDNDARRLARAEAPIRQITTGTVCHLEAEMVRKALEGWNLQALDFLFIENVGNLVCPASYDLGETLRLVLLSVTEGEDKPLKYPPIFNTADVAVITKIDLADAVEFDRAAAHRNIQSVRPGMQVFEVSAKTGAGMDKWVAFLESSLG